MPFLRLHTANRFKSTANSLRTYLDDLHQTGPLKRVSSFALFTLDGSVTVEAVFALPLFLFFMIHVMSAITMIETQSRLGAAMHQTGNQMAFAGYVYDKVVGETIPDGITSVALTEGYARNQILSYAGKDYLEHSSIQNGAAGVSFAGTSIMEKNDVIEIRLSYEIEPLFYIMGFNGFGMKQRYYGRAWTGYDVEDGVSDVTSEDPMVYVTQTGTVYHTNRNCTYLNPSVEIVSAEELVDRRNASGAKYYSCETCGSREPQGQIYITEYGSSYHCSITCSGLKRTIYTIPLSEVGGRGRCTKCQ